jgi:hypothetical protein
MTHEKCHGSVHVYSSALLLTILASANSETFIHNASLFDNIVGSVHPWDLECIIIGLASLTFTYPFSRTCKEAFLETVTKHTSSFTNVLVNLAKISLSLACPNLLTELNLNLGNYTLSEAFANLWSQPTPKLHSTPSDGRVIVTVFMELMKRCVHYLRTHMFHGQKKL